VRAPLVVVPPPGARHALGYLLRHLAAAAGRRRCATRVHWAAPGRGRTGWSDFARPAGWPAQLARDGVAHLHAHFISRRPTVAELRCRHERLPFSISAHAKDIYTSRDG
jgi:hypothetical protein